MQTAILYFSATGNTHWVARQLQKQRETAGETVTCIPFEQLAKQPVPPDARLFIGFPVYGFAVPGIFQTRILETVTLKGRDVYLFATVGLVPGDALARFADKLRQAGAVVIGGRAVRMPGSDGMGFMKPDSPTLRKMLERDFENLPELEQIQHDLQQPQLPPDRFPKDSPLRISAPKRLLYRLCRPLMARLETFAIHRLHADDTCTRCGLCARICPAGNITVTQQETVFGNRCILCMRCLHHCPAQAIQIASWTRNKYRYPGPGDSPFRPE